MDHEPLGFPYDVRDVLDKIDRKPGFMPDDVTQENWGQRKLQGYALVANFGWPIDRTRRKILDDILNKYGHTKVLLGCPLDVSTFPATVVADYWKGTTLGVYAQVMKDRSGEGG
jgi:hypothetical protein